jgi:hypothetical protein
MKAVFAAIAALGRLRTVIAAERPLSEAVDALEERKRGAVPGKLALMVE